MTSLNKLASAVDEYYQVREDRLAAEKVAKKIQERETELKNFLIDSISKSDSLGVCGQIRRATVVTQVVPQLVDFDALITHCRRRNEWDLIRHAISETAVKERWAAGKQVPGVGEFTVVKLSLTQI